MTHTHTHTHTFTYFVIYIVYAIFFYRNIWKQIDYFAEPTDVISSHGLIGNREINMQAHKLAEGT